MLNGDGRTTRQVSEKKQIEIRPGYNSEKKKKFEGLGHESAGVKNCKLHRL